MELESVRINKFRSILGPTEVDLSGLTVLIGPNNQGKSNILQAIRLGMETIALAQSRLRINSESGLAEMPHSPRPRSAFWRSRLAPQAGSRYDWLRDFPAQFRDNGRVKPASVLRFNFSLDERERAEFWKRTRTRNNGSLSVEITFTEDGIFLDFPKPGGSSSYRKAGRDICAFIEDHFTFLYVPAIRTADQAVEVISELITDRLASLAKNDEYVGLVARLDALHQEHARELSQSIGERLDVYMHGRSDLSIQMQTGSISVGGLRAIEAIELNDGVSTSILEKGDGVKSLLTMALLHDLADRGSASQVLLAIDEPEAHLHPDAVHKMAQVLREIATEQRVIVATHSPVLVNRMQLSKNLIVENNSVTNVHRIHQIRSCLGVRPFDNLSSAEFLVLTEGPTDCQVITAGLRELSQICADALADGSLVVSDAVGADNLPNRARFALEMMSDVVVVVDDDSAGRGVTDRLSKIASLDRGRIRRLSITGRGQSVLEDMYNRDLLERAYTKHTGLSLPPTGPVDRGTTWSDRMKKLFRGTSRLAEDEDLDPLKKDLAGWASISINQSLTPEALQVMQGIIATVEMMIKQRQSANAAAAIQGAAQ
ncbi:ATP-dependent endonuclease [Arthrobacter sp. NPDC056727]|uniref:ATP-dependent nuclease n=1 Tax=Arthrobacter sp. NPDC056727 TaxID=3345927 RepID=UPI00366B9F67